jgi:hypothetical protein
MATRFIIGVTDCASVDHANLDPLPGTERHAQALLCSDCETVLTVCVELVPPCVNMSVLPRSHAPALPLLRKSIKLCVLWLRRNRHGGNHMTATHAPPPPSMSASAGHTPSRHAPNLKPLPRINLQTFV